MILDGVRCQFVLIPDGHKPAWMAPFLVIRDTGHHMYLSLTNDAENVVKRLLDSGRLRKDQRLLYYDSQGDLAELLHDGHKFTGFGPPPQHEEDADVGS